jgi:Ca2+/Na+ antiporter
VAVDLWLILAALFAASATSIPELIHNLTCTQEEACTHGYQEESR